MSGDFAVDERQVYRVVTVLTDEETAHELRDRMVSEAGIDGSKLVIEEDRVGVDDGV